ncbi:SRPBCC family protein [Blastococcus sp. SYSU DS0619]
MPELVERVEVAAPPERVWAALTAWTRQGEWMIGTDVRTVEGPAQGVGGRLAARTGLPLPGGRHVGLLDTMVVTTWDPPRLVEVQHTGRLVRGPGIFEIQPRGEHSTFVWTERLDLPLGRLGRVGWVLIRPFALVGIRWSLKRFAAFARTFEPAAGPAGDR